MHTDSGMTGISLSGYMPYMTVASLEMSDEPKIKHSILQLFHKYRFTIISSHSIPLFYFSNKTPHIAFQPHDVSFQPLCAKPPTPLPHQLLYCILQ